MLYFYNWDIAHDTYVPLPTSKEDALWFLEYLEWLEYCYGDKYSSFTIGIGGHC
jgi:hypothetical protein